MQGRVPLDRGLGYLRQPCHPMQWAPTSGNLNGNSSGSSMPISTGFSASVANSQLQQHLPPQFTSTSSAEHRSMHHHHPHYQHQGPQNLQGGSESSSSSSVAGGGGIFGMGGLSSALPSRNSTGGGTNSGFLLRQLSDEESGDETARAEAILAKSKKSHFVQELVLSTLVSRHSW